MHFPGVTHGAIYLPKLVLRMIGGEKFPDSYLATRGDRFHREYQSELNKLRPLLAQKIQELHEMRAQFSKVTETAADLEVGLQEDTSRVLFLLGECQ